MDFSVASSLFVGLFFFFTLLYQYDLMETFLKNQIFNPAVINFSTALSGVGNRTHYHKLPQRNSLAKWDPPSQESQFPCLVIIQVFSKTHRWGKMTRESCWLWQDFLGVILNALTWALQPTPACVAPASLSTSGPGVGVGEKEIDVWSWLTISRGRNAAWELGEKTKHWLCASKMKHLFIVP